MKNFLDMLKPDNRITIGVSVSPNIGLEMIRVDTATNKVMQYAHRQIAYNNSTREIEDYGEFKQALTDLFSELKIVPQSANVVLNMPNVSFGHTFLPTVLDDESVTGAITSKVEENYLFKKNEPVVSWVEVKENNSAEKRYILYSAIQQGVIDILQQIFSDLGANLIAVENTYSSLIKTLEYTELTKDFALSGGGWNILLISQNSYEVFSMVGYSVIEYFEEPIAIKSFNNDEVYLAISQAATQVLDKYPTDKLLIISESNDVSEEILAIQLKQPGDVIFLESNQYAKTPIMDIDLSVLPHYIKAITPEAIGAAIYKAKDFNLKLNFIKNADVKATADTTNFMGLALTKEQLMLYSVVIGVAIIGLCFLASAALGSYINNLESQKANQEQEATNLQSELTSLKQGSGQIDIYSAAKTIDKAMVDKVLYYNAIGADIPSRVWLTSFYADSTGAYGIKGQTTMVDEVYLFFRNIKSQVPKSDLFLSKLSVDDKNGMIDIENATNVTYTFELTNSKFASVNFADPNAKPVDPTNPDAQAPADAQAQGGLNPSGQPQIPTQNSGSMNVPK